MDVTGRRDFGDLSARVLADVIGELPESGGEAFRRRDGESAGFGFIETLSRRLHREVRDSSDFLDAVDRAFVCKPSTRNSRDYQLLGETPLLRVGILTLFRFSPIAMHDHLGSHGAQLVLRGQARVRQYEHVSDAEKDRRLVMLERRVDRAIGRGDWISYTPDRLNIHEFQVQSQRIVLFSVMLHPPREESRSWFFSADPFDDNTKRLYARVRGRTPVRQCSQR